MENPKRREKRKNQTECERRTIPEREEEDRSFREPRTLRSINLPFSLSREQWPPPSDRRQRSLISLSLSLGIYIFFGGTSWNMSDLYLSTNGTCGCGPSHRKLVSTCHSLIRSLSCVGNFRSAIACKRKFQQSPPSNWEV